MAETQAGIYYNAETLYTAASDSSSSLEGADMESQLDGALGWATDRGTMFQYRSASLSSPVAGLIVKANGPGNWVRVQGGLNVVEVRSLADLPAPNAGIITLVAATRYLFYGTVNLGANRILTGSSVIIEGVGGAEITGNNAAPLISNGTNGVAMTIANVLVLNTGGMAVSWIGNGNGAQCILHDCEFYGLTVSVSVTGVGGDYINIYDNTFGGATGLQVGDIWSSVVLNNNRFKCTAIGVSITGTIGQVSAMLVNGNEFDVAGGLVGISQASVDAVTVGRLIGNMFFGGGTYISANVATTEWVGNGNVNVANF
jgi:hypothetical protein